MDNKLSLEAVTKLLQAADKLKTTVSPEYRGDNGLSINRDKLSTLNETMKIISGYIPDTRRLPFEHALNSCNRYCGVYCNLKRHFRGMKGHSPDVGNLLMTLKEVMPMMNNKQAAPIRKAVSIIEAMRS